MDAVKIISKILFYFVRFVAILYLGMAFHSLIALLTGWCLILHESNTKFKICLPFTNRPFLLGMYEWNYIAFGFLIPIALYGVFFWLLSDFFKAFAKKKLFTIENHNALKRFYLSNLIIPILTLIVASNFIQIEEIAEVMVGFHFLLGIFAFFIAAIFQQGINLQKEQDLFI
jgi:hypothetical protein